MPTSMGQINDVMRPIDFCLKEAFQVIQYLLLYYSADVLKYLVYCYFPFQMGYPMTPYSSYLTLCYLASFAKDNLLMTEQGWVCLIHECFSL